MVILRLCLPQALAHTTSKDSTVRSLLEAGANANVQKQKAGTSALMLATTTVQSFYKTEK